MDREISPEERLLRLIKGKNRPLSAERANIQTAAGETGQPIPASVPAASSGRSGAVLKPDGQKMPLLKAKVSGAADSMPKVKMPAGFNPYYLIAGFFVLLLIAGLYFLISASGTKEDQDVANLKQLVAVISSQAPAENAQAKPAQNITSEAQGSGATGRGSFDDYQKLIGNKAVFVPAAVEKKKTQAQEPAKLNELLKDLKLVGVIPGDVPQAIIEDKKNNQTLFLREGELVNGIEIKSVSAGRVVLNYGEETMTLSL
ncbi:MAG: hypothetical protein PHV77_05345 [Candidatus Omnitrophica bacterium]|nr:hypothetical protein [Candidatus Omnitrophota bacterium]